MAQQLEGPDLINLLPVEVLREIFNFLNFRDRLLSRLVCHRWLDVIRDQTPYHLEPKVVFNHCIIKPSLEPVKTFANSSFKCYKLMIGSRLTFAREAGHDQTLLRRFWQKFGKNVRHLMFLYSEENFDSNELSIADVIEILRFTPNLEELGIQTDKRRRGFGEFFHDALESLSPDDRQLLQQNLRNVKKLRVAGNQFNETQFRDLTALMPSLEELDSHDVQFFFEGSISLSSNFISHDALIEFCCTRADTLKGLYLMDIACYNRRYYYQTNLVGIGRVPGLKLKRLSCSVEDLTLAQWKEFLVQQNEIEWLKLSNTKNLEGSLVATAQRLPNLKHLMIQEGPEPLNIHECIKSFPQLESFDCFDYNIAYDFKDALTTNAIVPRPKLKVFKAVAIGFKKLPNIYPNLVTLNLAGSCMSDADLQNVFHCLPRLRKLQIDSCENITQNGLLGYRNGSISVTHSLSNLKGLRLLEIDHRDGLKLNCFERLNEALLELNVLLVEDSADFDENTARAVVRQCPNIEVLDTDECSLKLESFRILLENLSRLNTLTFSCEGLLKKAPLNYIHLSKSLKHLRFSENLRLGEYNELSRRWPSQFHSFSYENMALDTRFIEPKRTEPL